MPDIRIHRDHSLGLSKARKVAWLWAEQVEREFDMQCTVIEGEYSDTVEFTRSGVNGTLVVADDHFDLNAKLGFLLGAFSRTIESEIQKNLDDLLGQAGGTRVADKAAAKGAAKTAAKTAAKSDAKGAVKVAAKKAPPRKKA